LATYSANINVRVSQAGLNSVGKLETALRSVYTTVSAINRATSTITAPFQGHIKALEQMNKLLVANGRLLEEQVNLSSKINNSGGGARKSAGPDPRVLQEQTEQLQRQISLLRDRARVFGVENAAMGKLRGAWIELNKGGETNLTLVRQMIRNARELVKFEEDRVSIVKSAGRTGVEEYQNRIRLARELREFESDTARELKRFRREDEEDEKASNKRRAGAAAIASNAAKIGTKAAGKVDSAFGNVFSKAGSAVEGAVIRGGAAAGLMAGADVVQAVEGMKIFGQQLPQLTGVAAAVENLVAGISHLPGGLGAAAVAAAAFAPWLPKIGTAAYEAGAALGKLEAAQPFKKALTQGGNSFMEPLVNGLSEMNMELEVSTRLVQTLGASLEENLAASKVSRLASEFKNFSTGIDETISTEKAKRRNLDKRMRGYTPGTDAAAPLMLPAYRERGLQQLSTNSINGLDVKTGSVAVTLAKSKDETMEILGLMRQLGVAIEQTLGLTTAATAASKEWRVAAEQRLTVGEKINAATAEGLKLQREAVQLANKEAFEKQREAAQKRLNNNIDQQERLKASKAAKAEAFNQRAESIMLGVGFPLLFGAGAGSVGGSLAGSFVGSGFGGQIFGGALGAQFDALSATAQSLSASLRSPADALAALENAGIKLGEGTKESIRLLVEQGRLTDAQNVLQKGLASVIGTDGVNKLVELENANRKAGEEASKLTLILISELAPAFTFLANAARTIIDKIIGPAAQRQAANINPQAYQAAQTKAATQVSKLGVAGDRAKYEQLLNNYSLDIVNKSQAAMKTPTLSKESLDTQRKASEALADKIQSAYREGFALQQKGHDLERQAVDLRRNFENEVFNRRQEIARLEISNQRQAAQVQIEAVDLALRKQFAGAEGFEAQVLGAAREYIKSTAEGQADLEAKRRGLDLDLAKIRKGVQDYEYGVQQQINSFIRATEQYKMDVADYQLKIGRQINEETRLTAAAMGAGGGITNGAGFSSTQITKATTDASKFTGIANECAESVKSFYKSLGMSLPGVTAWADSVRKAGRTMTDWSKLQPGDIVAKGKPGDTRHVGVYTGGNNVFHQSQSRGLKAGNFPDLGYFQQGGYFVRPTTGAKLIDARNNIRPTALGTVPTAPGINGLGSQLEAATKKQIDLETKLGQLKEEGALFAFKQTAEGPRVLQQRTDELNLLQSEVSSLRSISQQEQERETRAARNNQILAQTAAENERILAALKPQLDPSSYAQIESALSTRLDLKRQELLIDQQMLELAQQRQFLDQRNGLKSQLGVVGTGFKAGFIGNAASTYENTLMQTGDAGKALELADLTRQIDLAKLSSDAFNQSITGIGDAFATSMANGIGSLTTGAASAKQIFANMLNAMASALISAGTRMIATYIAIGLAKMFAGMSGGGHATSLEGVNMADVTKYASAPPIPFAEGGVMTSMGAMPLRRYSQGGIANRPQMAMYGEGSQPEAFVPLPDGRRIPVNLDGGDRMRQMMGRSPAEATTPVLNMSFQTTNIGGVEYVSRDQLEQAMHETRRQATKDGAKRGMSMTLDKLQQSPSTRSRVGMR
jgi:hypothetical protein